MADYDLVRDVLDEQLVDESGREIGKADGILMQLRPGAPPRLVAIEVGLPVLGYRLHPAVGRLLDRFNRWMRLPHDGRARLPFTGIDVRPTGIQVPIDVETTGAAAWERWLRRHVINHVPGGRGPAKSKEEQQREEARRHPSTSRQSPATPQPEDAPFDHRQPGEIPLEWLLGRKVLVPDGRVAGRLEEVRVERQGEELVVTEYLIGTRALLERLSVGALFVHEGGIGGGYAAWWHQLDLRDVVHPRLTCALDDLRTFGSRAHR